MFKWPRRGWLYYSANRICVITYRIGYRARCMHRHGRALLNYCLEEWRGQKCFPPPTSLNANLAKHRTGVTDTRLSRLSCSKGAVGWSACDRHSSTPSDFLTQAILRSFSRSLFGGLAKKQQHARAAAQVQAVRACFTLSEQANASSLRSGIAQMIPAKDKRLRLNRRLGKWPCWRKRRLPWKHRRSIQLYQYCK